MDDSDQLNIDPETHNGADHCGQDDLAEKKSASVVVLDLSDPEALCLAQEMAQDIGEVKEGLQIAQQAGMQFLFVALLRYTAKSVCVPVNDRINIPRALNALCDVMKADRNIRHTVVWVMVPESLGATMRPHLESLEMR